MAQNISAWRKIQAQFDSGAREHPNFSAFWRHYDQRWTMADIVDPNYLRGPRNTAPQTLAANEKAEELFREAARAAIELMGRSVVNTPQYHVWLELMKTAGRGFEWAQGSWSNALAVIDVDSRLPASAYQEHEDGRIIGVFKCAAEFCVDLAKECREPINPLEHDTGVQGSTDALSILSESSFIAGLASEPLCAALDEVSLGISSQLADWAADALKSLSEFDWTDMAATLDADVAKIDEALRYAVPFTPRSKQEEIDIFERFTTDPRGLGLSNEEFCALLTPAEWLEHFQKWKRSRVGIDPPQGANLLNEAAEPKAREQIAQLAVGGKLDKGNLAILRNLHGELKEYVNLDVAARFGGVSRRAIEKAVAKGALIAVGFRLNRRISVGSLLQYFPAENECEPKRTDAN